MCLKRQVAINQQPQIFKSRQILYVGHYNTDLTLLILNELKTYILFYYLE